MKKNDFTVPHGKITPDLTGWIVISYQEVKETKTTFSHNTENQIKDITSSEQIIYRADIKNIVDRNIITYNFPSNFPIEKDDFIFVIFHSHQEHITIEKYYNYRTEKMATEYKGFLNEHTLHKLNTLERICKQCYCPLLGLIEALWLFFNSEESCKSYKFYQKLFNRVVLTTYIELLPLTLGILTFIHFKKLYIGIIAYLFTFLLSGKLIIKKLSIPLIQKNIDDFTNEIEIFDEYAVNKVKELISNPEVLTKAKEIISNNLSTFGNEPPVTNICKNNYNDKAQTNKPIHYREKRAISRNGFNSAVAEPMTNINTTSDLLIKLRNDGKLKEIKGYLDEKCIDKQGYYRLVYYKRRLANLIYNNFIKKRTNNKRSWLLDFKSEKEVFDALTKEEEIYYLKK